MNTFQITLWSHAKDCPEQIELDIETDDRDWACAMDDKGWLWPLL